MRVRSGYSTTILPVSQKGLKVDYDLLLMLGEIPSFDTRSKIISPSKPAALAASHQTLKKMMNEFNIK